jgi:hypothetical protein
MALAGLPSSEQGNLALNLPLGLAPIRLQDADADRHLNQIKKANSETESTQHERQPSAFSGRLTVHVLLWKRARVEHDP